MKLLYYLAAIGNHSYDTKINIFFKNITLLANQVKNGTVDVIINMYDKNDSFIQDISKCKYIEKHYVHHKKGVLVELWKTNPYHDIIHNYDHILFMYDDVLLTRFNLDNIMLVKNIYQLDIISPKVIGCTHTFLMNNFKNNESLFITNAIEIYCILLSPKTFQRYLEIQDIKNKWTWGTDFLLGHFKLKCGVYEQCTANHLFPQKHNNYLAEARKCMNTYIKKYGFHSLHDIMAAYSPILKKL